ncbi:MAG TPA: Crp/Fnr family transcriptional regulator [Stellaceae bacterium]|nr:Crp/Fnr family transcriptional regulator [Stellaceae bacterium]
MNFPIQAIRNRVLTRLPPEELQQLIAHLEPVTLPKKEILFEVGSPLDHVYFIDEGVASVLTTMEDGALSEVGMVGNEGLVGVSALLGGDTSAQQVVMQLPGRGHRIAARRCKRVFEASPKVRAAVLRFTEDLLNLSSQTAGCNRLHSVEQRSARWLLMASDRMGSDYLPLTQEFLAAMLGVRRSGVSEAAGELQRSGLIRYRRGKITIIDRAGLEDSACECYRLDKCRTDRMFD